MAPQPPRTHAQWSKHISLTAPNLAHARGQRSGLAKSGHLAAAVLSAPDAYLDERKEYICRLKNELNQCNPTLTPALRAESRDESLALVPGFDIDIREDIEQAKVREARAGSGYVVVMGKPFKSAHAEPSPPPGEHQAAQAQPDPMDYTQYYTQPVASDPPIAREHPKVPKLPIAETVAGAANRAKVRAFKESVEAEMRAESDRSGGAPMQTTELEESSNSMSAADLYKSYAQQAHREGRRAYDGQQW